jgi:glutamate-1-semialdehyde aminotransferase
MAAASKLFISSTFFPNSDGYVAALKTIEVLERDNVIDSIWKKGDHLLAGIQKVIDKHQNAGAELSGVSPMFFVTFTKGDPNTTRGRRTDFYTQMIRKGFFFTPHHHAYICYRHTEEDLDKTIQAMDESMAYISDKYKG